MKLNIIRNREIQQKIDLRRDNVNDVGRIFKLIAK